MRQAMTRQRSRDTSRGAKWLTVGGITVLMLAVAFGLGVLVGRHHLHQGESVHAAGDVAKRPVSTPRRSGLAEPPPDRPAVQEKLTFYQTLTAPLEPVPTATKVDAGAKVDAAKHAVPDRIAAVPPTERAASPATGAANTDKPTPAPTPRPVQASPAPSAAGPDKPVPAQTARPAQVSGATPGPDWTVQVGAFKEPSQAESVRKPLAAAGLAAYLVAVPADDGQVRYKVRVGAFKTREEALRMAERMRQERSLATFVTQR